MKPRRVQSLQSKRADNVMQVVLLSSHWRLDSRDSQLHHVLGDIGFTYAESDLKLDAVIALGEQRTQVQYKWILF
jgi:hypothetical protein